MLALQTDEQRSPPPFRNAGRQYRPPIVNRAAPDSCHVLVVDDDEFMRHYFWSVLRDAGFAVELAASGAEALQTLGQTRCDILLTDWQMPDMDGPALCRQVREDHRDRELFIVMLTVRSTQQDRLTGLAAGADDYIVKGTPLRELRARLERGRNLLRKGRFHTPQCRDTLPFVKLDPLTSEGFFSTRLPNELLRCRRERRALSVLSCRIVDFAHAKSYGRDVTNEALRAFAANVRTCVRRNLDWLARVGEDQFMVVMPECPPETAARVARRLRRRFARVPIATPVGPLNFTARISVTAVTVPLVGPGWKH